jgi:hypothetical protein
MLCPRARPRKGPGVLWVSSKMMFRLFRHGGPLHRRGVVNSAHRCRTRYEPRGCETERSTWRPELARFYSYLDDFLRWRHAGKLQMAPEAAGAGEPPLAPNAKQLVED